MNVYVEATGDTKFVTGGGVVDGCNVDIAHEVKPGDVFCGLSFDELKPGKYVLDLENDRVTPVSE